MTVFERLLLPITPILADIERNRQPHFNETHSWTLFVHILVYHFTKGFQSMRELVTGLQNADPALHLPALPRSTISQMFTRFDPALLHLVLQRLLKTLPLPEVPELAQLGTIYLADGSHFPTLRSMVWEKSADMVRHVKLHLVFDVGRMVPVTFLMTPPQSSERAALETMLQAGVTYVLDRGYMEFALFKAIVSKQSSVVMRAYRSMVVETIEEYPVDLPIQVTNAWASVRDRLVTSSHPDMEGVLFRLVECTIGTSIYRLMTDRTDRTTFQVILLYAYRWQIELVFRTLKWTMNGIYTITEHERGMQSFFAALLITSLLHMHLKRDCLAQEGHFPPTVVQVFESQADNVQSSTDTSRPTAHLAIACFMANLNDIFARFWKISKHWLHTLAAYLYRPFTEDVVRILNKHALRPS